MSRDTANNPSFDPNLGVLSAFQGVGDAISDVGKLGMVDALETRRSKMENDLRLQLKGEDQTFSREQADTENTRKVDAAAVKFGRDKKLQTLKNKEKAAGFDKEMANKEMLAPDGKTPVSMGEVRKIYADSNGLNSDMIDWDRMEPDFNKWAKQNKFTWRNETPEPPPKLTGIDEETARSRAMETNPGASEEEIDSFIEEMRKEGLIVGGQQPGVMDAVAAEAGAGGNGQFAGGAPQGVKNPPAVAAEPVKPAILDANVNAGDAAIAGAGADVANKVSNKKNLVNQLMKYKAAEPVESVARRSTRAQSRNDSRKIQKAANGVVAALDKGNIKQVGKDRVKLALKNAAFVNSLSEADLQVLIDYLEN